MTTELTPDKALRMASLNNQCFDERRYDYDFSFRPGNADDPFSAHTTFDMLRCMEHNPKIELDSRILTATPDGLKVKSLNRDQFKESWLKNDKEGYRFREGFDVFGIADGNQFQSGLVGQDFTPLLGGPFYKNLYYYQDYIRMHSECFFAYHHDPIAKAIIAITTDFVLGTGYEIQCDMSERVGQVAMATWKAFEQVNNLHEQIHDCCNEIAIYGETMFWWLPKNEAKIIYRLGPTDTLPLSIIPRVRLLDPSNMVEIVTYPEDITRKLFYVWLTPTQYQIYTSSMGSQQNLSTEVQPSLKFIYQQIPADQIMHTRVNAVSNEKRGRSDLFPVLSYLKRLRDSVNYALIADQKVSAWSMDTTVDGAQSDIDSYVAHQASLGTIPPAGSEFVHSKAITRQYLGNHSGGGKMSDAFLYSISLICAGTQIPFNYLGTHLSGGSTRASAIVATEPVAKKMEARREVIKRILKEMWRRLMKDAGIPTIDCKIIFPEIITQDRSQKLQDLLLMQQAKWIKPERAAAIAAKEIGIDDYDYNAEQEEIAKQTPQPQAAPGALTDPSQIGGLPPLPPLPGLGKAGQDVAPNTSAITSQDRQDIKQNGTSL